MESDKCRGCPYYSDGCTASITERILGGCEKAVPLIDYNTSVALRLKVDNLSKIGINGIKNQIYHLGAPDNNDAPAYIFGFLEREINGKVEGWLELKTLLQKIEKGEQI